MNLPFEEDPNFNEFHFNIVPFSSSSSRYTLIYHENNFSLIPLQLKTGIDVKL